MRKRKIVYSGIILLALVFSGFFLYAGNASRQKFCLPKSGDSTQADCSPIKGYHLIPSIVLF